MYLWHKEHDLQGVDAVFLPGGFSYGDYLRAGAIAAHSPIMREVIAFAQRRRAGGGDLQRLPDPVRERAAARRADPQPDAQVPQPPRLPARGARRSRRSPSEYTVGEVLRIPIAHGEGCYTAEPAVLDELEAEGRVVFRYCDREGEVTADANPNGSARNIAGIVNAAGNVLGMMPHPERAIDLALGSHGRAGVVPVAGGVPGRRVRNEYEVRSVNGTWIGTWHLGLLDTWN